MVKYSTEWRPHICGCRLYVALWMEAIFDQIECIFLQKTLGSYLTKAQKKIGLQKNRFGGAGEAFLRPCVTLRKLRIFTKIEDFVYVNSLL